MVVFGFVGVSIRYQGWTILVLIGLGGCFDMYMNGCVKASKCASPNEEPLLQSLVGEADPIELDSVGVEDFNHARNVLEIEAESDEVDTADINTRESGDLMKRAAIVVPDRKGWYGTWQVLDILCRRTLESEIAGVMDFWIFEGNSLSLQWVLEKIPERASCELTNIVYYNPLSDANLMHLQPLQQKTQKQIHWIVIFA